jgi:hypothetical protein
MGIYMEVICMSNLNEEFLDLDRTSLVKMLNFILNNLKDDRRLALQHHTILSHMLNGVASAGLSTLELQMMIQDLSSSLNGFLTSASKSTENAIKMSKIMADAIKYAPQADGLTDKDRDNLADLMAGLDQEKTELAQTISDMRPLNEEGYEDGS